MSREQTQIGGQYPHLKTTFIRPMSSNSQPSTLNWSTAQITDCAINSKPHTETTAQNTQFLSTDECKQLENKRKDSLCF